MQRTILAIFVSILSASPLGLIAVAEAEYFDLESLVRAQCLESKQLTRVLHDDGSVGSDFILPIYDTDGSPVTALTLPEIKALDIPECFRPLESGKNGASFAENPPVGQERNEMFR